uniref:Si:dkey-288a3.2 n=1 Tax=Cyclopterus lumpus TaxID=8103 RepID=A0A8C2XRS6_CYCLU
MISAEMLFSGRRKKRKKSAFRAVQFCLLANSLPIISRLIACLYQGERLDQRSCEALEVVLKSLHFDFINLQAAQLEENGASSLLDMILYYESTTHLDMSDNSSMGTLCWRALAHLIKQSVRLSRLDVCNVPMVDYPARSLSKALLTSRLTVLHLHNAQLSGMPLYTLVGALKSNKALKELHLTNNLLNSYQDALHLGDLLRYNTTLQTMELKHNIYIYSKFCRGKWICKKICVYSIRFCPIENPWVHPIDEMYLIQDMCA